MSSRRKSWGAIVSHFPLARLQIHAPPSAARAYLRRPKYRNDVGYGSRRGICAYRSVDVEGWGGRRRAGNGAGRAVNVHWRRGHGGRGRGSRVERTLRRVRRREQGNGRAAGAAGGASSGSHPLAAEILAELSGSRGRVLEYSCRDRDAQSGMSGRRGRRS